MPSAERKVANAANNNNNVQVPASNQQQAVISKSGSIDSPTTPLQQVLVMVDKKVRNLDKRKTKLEQLKEQSKEAPKELTTEQRKALAKCEEVVEILEFFKDFRKSINSLFIESQKAIKAKEQKEKAERAKEEREKVKNVLLIQELLVAIGNTDIRKALTDGSAGMEVSEERMKQLDELYEITNPKRNEPGYSKNLDVAASRLNDLVDGKRKDAFKGVTFQELRDLILSVDKSPILAPYSSNSAPNESAQQQRPSEQPESIDNVTPSPPLTNNNDQSSEQHQQPQQQPNHPSLNNFVSFGSLDSTGSHDPAIVGFLPPVTSAGIIFPAYPVPLQPGQLPPFLNNGTAVFQAQSQPQLQEHQLPLQQQQPPTGEFTGLNLNDQQNKQIQGGERQGDNRFKGPRGPRKEWNRGNKNGPPRDHRNRNQDGRTQGAPHDSQRYNNPRGPREHNNNNFPNGGGGGFAGRPRNFNGPRTGNAASTVAGAGTGGGQKV